MDNYTGKRIDGRYEIQEVIGVGGMAVVYRAYDNIDDRIVAVKILKDEYLANEEFRRRFKNESKAIAVLSHPNIVKVYNVSYGDKLQYIVMEYVEGITLKEYIEQQGRLGIKETVHFTMQILRALQHAHDKGIVHRDIKPQNIMLLSNGSIKVTDFGIARFSYSDTKTMTDSAIGSVHYISPEQAKGETTDDRADIYSVGVVMYEMLTGQLPFQSDNSVSVALMQLQNEAKRPRELNNNIPVGLEQIVMHAMRKTARERYQSAAEMLLDIEEFKRNPTIRFQKDYFVDNDPTKYVNKKPSVPTVPPVVTPPVTPPPAVDPGFGLENDDEETENDGNRKTAIILGVVAGFVMFIIAAIAILWFVRPEIIDSIPVLNKIVHTETASVPDFVGKNFEKDIDGKAKYEGYYNFEIIEEPKTGYENGVVHAQDPKSGTERKDGEVMTVTLYVTNNNKKSIVPDVVGMNWEQAQKQIESKGFKVYIVPEMNLTESFGTVLRTDPKVGDEVDVGSTINIYYASDANMITVVDATGWDVSTSTALLQSQGLKVNPVVIEEDSDKPAGEVISHSPKAGDLVYPGTEVVLTVSTGVPLSSEAKIVFNLPSKSSRGTLEVFVNNELSQEKPVLLDGSSYELLVQGSGENKSVKVYIDGKEHYTCTVNFTSNPAVVTNATYTNGFNVTSAKLPDVTGKTETEARSELAAAGFWNVYVTGVPVIDPKQNGVILSQSPKGGTSGSLFGSIYSVDQKIDLIVGQLEGVF
ncbi:MAG: Stk1 family PASTA domain-containing Ser/Thr kinase [Clostridia bacterium]|nr:Stk1 family PASTA domain-containing Ser/Thr kinase [Clostridia bacterium]